MRVLHPARTDAADDVLDRPMGLDDLAVLYAAPAPPGAWLRVNMVSTLDGAATGADGLSGSINTPADKIVFELLRAISDAVIVGAGTVRTEGYSPLLLTDEFAALRQAVGLPDALPLVVVSRSGALPELVLQQSDDRPVHAVVPVDCPALARLRAALGAEAVHTVGGGGRVDLDAGLSALHGLGWRRLHSEGGPSLVADLLAAGLVDELDLTIVPRLVAGSFRRITSGDILTPPRDFHPTVLLEQDGSLIGRWLRGGAVPSG